jgi:alpha-glucosidase
MPEQSGAAFRFENTILHIRFLSPDFLFVYWDDTDISPSYAVEKVTWPDIDVKLTQQGTGWQVCSSQLDVRVDEVGKLEFWHAGILTRTESPLQKQAGGWSHTVHLDPETGIYGLGERAATLNLRPGTYRLWNRDSGSYGPGIDPLYITMPVYLVCQEVGSYLAFYDNSWDGNVYLDKEAEVRFDGGPIRYYLAFGSPDQTIARFTELVGRPPLPPRWSLGYQHSRWGFGSEKEVRQVYAGFQRHRLPVSALVLDIDHQNGYRTLTVNKEKFQTLPAFSDELAREDVHLISIVDPGIKEDRKYLLYQEGLKEDAFCKTPQGDVLHGVVWPGWSVFPDFSNPRVRKWWGRQYEALLQEEIGGFWHDMNEPDSFAAWGEPTFPWCTLHDNDGRGVDHRQVHNIYGLLMNKSGFEGLRNLRPGRRPFILSRSGWVGMQKYAWSWTGDLESSWEMLRQTIPTVLGLGLSGLPYTGPDIGGSFGQPTPELYLRWFELAAFMPFFRTHSAFYLPPREPWEFDGEVLEAVRCVLELRYRLLPYWYTLAWQASLDGLPLLRPLFWDDPQDPRLRSVDDAFLLGEALLVAPVIQQGSRERFVRLPKGKWYRFGTNSCLDGGGDVLVTAALEEIPLFVRSGSIIPELEGKDLHIHIYRPNGTEEGEGVIYSDAGDGYGDSRIEKFSLVNSGKDEYHLLTETIGTYSWPYAATHIHLHGFGECRLEMDGQMFRSQGNTFLVPSLTGLSIHIDHQDGL